MGCATSKEVRCEHCNRPVSVRSLSYSSPFSRRSRYKGDNKSDKTHSQRLSDSQNVVSVTNNVNIKRYLEDQEGKMKAHSKPARREKVSKKKSRKANTTPSPKAKTINTWELMEGLEDNIPPDLNKDTCDFSFPIANDSSTAENDTEPNPMRLQGAPTDSVPNSISFISDFDPEIISTFQKALEELSPQRVNLLRSPEKYRMASPGHQVLFSVNSRDTTSSPGYSRLYSNDIMDGEEMSNEIVTSRSLPCGQNGVVIYCTSLRGIRKTYEDCCHVRMIFKGLGVKVDERDVSMHYGFREELRQVLGTEGLIGKLPKVFVKGRYIGGADDVRRMHDDGELVKILEGCEMTDGSGVCEMCCDARFVPCEMCSGSCKIYIEVNGERDGEGEEGEGEYEGNEGGFQRCPYCNENGLVRCITCCSE